ncbi:unnamed protein product [Scytosiphon promiscuus]
MPGAVDTGIALFVLVFSAVFLTVAAGCMVLLYRERNAFEIKARSAYLLMLTGASFIGVILKITVSRVDLLFAYDENVYVAKTVKFFVVVCSTCCYGSRTIRLAMLYSPKARQTAPWLLPERNHVVVCIVLGLATMCVPLVDLTVVREGPDKKEDFVDTAEWHLWITSVTCQAVVIGLNPLAWLVDDIFNLGRELRVMAVVLFLEILGGALVDGEDTDVTRWIDAEKLLYIRSIIMFSVSVIHPIRRRILHPMQSSDPKVVQRLERRKRAGPTTMSPSFFSRDRGRGQTPASHVFRSSTSAARRFSWYRRDSDVSSTGSAHFADDGFDSGDVENGGVGGAIVVTAAPDTGSTSTASVSDSPGSWTYERVMFMPAVASAFEEFSRKALCQESFLFLKDVAAYQDQIFKDEESKQNDVDGDHEGSGGFGRGDAEQEAQFLSFSLIVREYIVDGAPNEINISSRDKKSILEVHSSGKPGFFDLTAKAKRLVFARAYSEIRFLLERNLMLKFTSTERFKESLVEDRKRQKCFPH